jgi:hypothetical protein
MKNDKMTRIAIFETESGLLAVLFVLFSKEIYQKLEIAFLSTREEDLNRMPQEQEIEMIIGLWFRFLVSQLRKNIC